MLRNKFAQNQREIINKKLTVLTAIVGVVGLSILGASAALAKKDQFQLTQVDHVGLRHQTVEEFTHAPSEAKGLTPVYYVIEVKTASGTAVILFISSNNKDHVFQLKQNQ